MFCTRRLRGSRSTPTVKLANALFYIDAQTHGLEKQGTVWTKAELAAPRSEKKPISAQRSFFVGIFVCNLLACSNAKECKQAYFLCTQGSKLRCIRSSEIPCDYTLNPHFNSTTAAINQLFLK